MHRRMFFQLGLATVAMGTSRIQASDMQLAAAADMLQDAVTRQVMDAATLVVRRGPQEVVHAFGKASTGDAIFLIASISKPMSVAALMRLHEQGLFRLDQPVGDLLPEFQGDGRRLVTVEHLLTHVSGLPDQLPENEELRRRNASLSEFVERALRTPLLFTPGTQFGYSSMGILLASEIAQRLSGIAFPDLLRSTVLEPLEMRHSALGLGKFQLDQTMSCQVEHAAVESGSGDPASKTWDWNSPYWRNLAAPWGGVHASAPDVAKFLSEFLRPSGKMLQSQSIQRMVTNQNRIGLKPRGFGFAMGAGTASPGCSDRTFGHSGSTGTLAWADPVTDTLCVVLTSLPAQAVEPHPRQLASNLVAKAVSVR